MKRFALSIALAPMMLAAAPHAVAQQADDGASTIEPRNTRGLPERLQPIDDVLRGGLLNDPTDLSFDSYGPGLSSDLVVDESYPGGGAALRVQSTIPGEVYTTGLIVPLLSRINSGDIVTVGFFARALESSAEDGNGRVFVRFQQNRPPFPGFGDTMLEIGPEWRFYEVSATASRAIRRDAIVAMQLGEVSQTVEIGQTIVVSGTPSVLD